MTVDKFDNVWANGGDLGTAPTDEKKETGFVRNDEPPFQRFNYLQNRVEKKLNEVIREGVSTLYDTSTDNKFMVASGLFGESWASAGDSQNQISGGSAKSYSSMVVNIDTDGNPFLVVADNTNLKFERWNSRELTLQLTSAVYTDDLPAGTWELYSLCTDNANIFGLFFESVANTWQVQSWSATDLAVNPSWPTTGVTLPGTGTVDGLSSMPKIIVSSSSTLATLNAWFTGVSASSDASITIINKSVGTITASGSGDISTIDVSEPRKSLSSDGTNLFFSGYGNTSGNKVLCSATIADPTVGCGGTGFPRTVSQTVLSICPVGSFMFATINAIGVAATTAIAFTFDSSNADLFNLQLGNNSLAGVGDRNILANGYNTVFDGFNVWIYGSLNAGTESPPVAIKIDMGRMFLINDIDSIGLPDVTEGSYPLVPSGDVTMTTASKVRSSIISDGRDIWTIIEPDGGNTYSGKIIRIPLASLRG